MNEIRVKYKQNETNVYACIFNNLKQVCTVATGVFGTWNDSNIDDYDVPLAENGGGGMFWGTFPATIAAGDYVVVAYQGDKDASGDDVELGSSEIRWNGTSETTFASGNPTIK